MPLLHIEHPTTAADLEQESGSSEMLAQPTIIGPSSDSSRPFQGLVVGAMISIPMWAGIIVAARYVLQRF